MVDHPEEDFRSPQTGQLGRHRAKASQRPSPPDFWPPKPGNAAGKDGIRLVGWKRSGSVCTIMKSDRRSSQRAKPYHCSEESSQITPTPFDSVTSCTRPTRGVSPAFSVTSTTSPGWYETGIMDIASPPHIAKPLPRVQRLEP